MINHLVKAVLFSFAFLWQTLAAMVMFFVPKARKDVSGEIVLITGAGSGLGRLMSFRFASLGSVVVCVDINEQANEETARDIQSKNQRAFAFTCDCSKKEDIFRMAEKVKAEVGNVTILINNAGIVSGKKFLDTPDSLVEKTFEVNALAHCWTTKAFLPSMLANHHGHVVSIASLAGLAGVPRLTHYSSSKFAVVGFMESLQMELTASGVTNIFTTVVCPYLIDTGMFEGAKTRFPLLLPVLDPVETVEKIMFSILANQRVLIIPSWLSLILIIKSVIPQESFIALSTFLGASSAMDDFKGRCCNQENKELHLKS